MQERAGVGCVDERGGKCGMDLSTGTYLQAGVTLRGVGRLADVQHLHELQHQRVHAGKLQLNEHRRLAWQGLVDVRPVELVGLTGGVECGLDVQLLRPETVAAHDAGEREPAGCNRYAQARGRAE